MVGLRVAHEFVDAHPLRQLALLGEVADAAQHADRVANRVETENADRSRLRAQQTEQVLEERRLARAVGTHEAADLAPCGAEEHTLEGGLTAERSRELINVDDKLSHAYLLTFAGSP